MSAVKNESTLDIAKFSEFFLRKYNYMFLGISKAMNVVFELSVTISPCERGFKTQNLNSEIHLKTPLLRVHGIWLKVKK